MNKLFYPALIVVGLFLTISVPSAHATKYISDNLTGGDCVSIGNWDSSTKTCVLTTDLTETIQIDSNGITLDGESHSVTGSDNVINGIFLNNKSNVSIKNTNINGFVYSIHLNNSSNNILTNNTFSNTNTGVGFDNSSNNTLANNNFSNIVNGISLQGNYNIIRANVFTSNIGINGGVFISGSHNLIEDNVSDSGIYIWYVNGNTLRNNHMQLFDLQGSSDSQFDNDIDTSNLINGKPIYYIRNVSNVTYDSSTNAATFYCINCNNITVRDLTLNGGSSRVYFWKTNNSHIENVSASNNYPFGGDVGGIIIRYSSNNTITSNHSSNSSSIGINLFRSNNNIINNNNLDGNGLGILLTESGQNTISENTISNSDVGIEFNFGQNTIYNNNFINNTNQVTIDRINQGNVFNLALPIGGNYWSDFDTSGEGCNDSNANKICDAAYIFSGGQDGLPWTIIDGWLPSGPSISDIDQFDSSTSISESSTIIQSSVLFKATLTSGQNLQSKLEIELKKFNESFDGTNTQLSSFVDSGDDATITISNLSDGDYHWRARAVDSNNNASAWQEFGTAGNIDFTVQLRNPLIIIPGILGTKLVKDYGNHSEIWPDLSDLAFPFDLHLNDLSLSGEGEELSEFPMTLGDIIREINIPFSTWWDADIFDSLITDLTSAEVGYIPDQDLIVFPYDWRLDNKHNADRLSLKIQEILDQGYSKVDIVAHSMGGLIAKEYVKTHASDVDKLIFVGTPHDGAPQAFNVLMYGDDLNIPILNKHRANFITQNMPSVYQLLPSERYVNTNNHKYVLDLAKAYDDNSIPEYLDYNETKTHMINSGRNYSMFPIAKDLHDDIDNISLSGIDTYNFTGCGLGTTAKIIPMKKEITSVAGIPVFVDGYGWGVTSGDTTVPKISSNDQTTNHQYYVNKVVHGNLPSADGIKETITSILLGQTPGTFTNVSTSSSVCTPITGDVVSDHSPVELHIYDSQNRHTGPTSNGDIEYGIPGVTYEILGEDKFAYLPEGQTYTVKNSATATGSYTFMDQKIENEEVIKTIIFNDVPLPNTATKSSITITGINQTNFTLNIDNDGNGSYESTKSPTSSLTETQSADITRPETISSISGTAGDNDWYKSDVTVTLTATDDNSGILKTEYSADNGVTWQTYSDPFVVTANDTNVIKYFSTDKAGNIEVMQSKTFKIDKTTPVTTISISGTAGTNGWYKSSYVDVTFEATDNLSGMSLIEYSLDDGATWTTYSSLFQIDDNPAINTLKYRSKDNAGNLESIHTQIIKIDRMPPRALMYFDPQTRFLKIVGLEDVSYATVTKINDENYVVKDEAGNALEINIDPTYVGPKTTTLNGKVVNGVSSLNIRVISMFNGSYIVTPEENLVFHYEWNTTTVNGVPKFTLFNQTMDLPDRKLIANYNYLKNTTTISTRFDTDITDPGIPQTETLNGLRIIKLTTPQGSWDFDVEY